MVYWGILSLKAEKGEDAMNPEKPNYRPEIVLGCVTVLSAILLAIMIALSLPYIDLPRRVPAPTKATEVTTVPEETTLETTEETMAPTIPPDPNPYDRADFQYNYNNYLLLEHGESYPGIDVSAFQGKIDWEQVRRSGIRFAMIRLGYRGYGQKGTLVEDEFVDANLKGAKEAGLFIGAYFFSQATTIEEVDEEIEFFMEILGDTQLTMPIVFDWEYISETARTANVDARTLTDMTLHFCREMEKRGLQPMVYFNWHQANTLMYLSELEDYPFWLALYSDRMNYPFKIEMWQYTASGKVPGIPGDVDINVYIP